MLFVKFYACIPCFQAITSGDFVEAGIQTWSQLLDLRLTNSHKTVAELLEAALSERLSAPPSTSFSSSGLLPSAQDIVVRIGSFTAKTALVVGVRVNWQYYVGEQAAYRVNGSFCHADNRFMGAQFAPPLDREHPPGKGWVALHEKDAAMVSMGGVFIPLPGAAEVVAGIRRDLASTALASSLQ